MITIQSEEVKALKRVILCLKQQLKLERFIASEYKKQIDAARELLTGTLPAAKTDAVLADMKEALDS